MTPAARAVLPVLLLALAPLVACASGGSDLDDLQYEAETVQRAEELMIGRFPGVRVYQVPGGGIYVRVWGPATIYGDAEPLYVVDGVPVHVSPGRGLDWLNPGDIADIQVLKDISETSAYGIRGGNGVVLITTKKGGD